MGPEERNLKNRFRCRQLGCVAAAKLTSLASARHFRLGRSCAVLSYERHVRHAIHIIRTGKPVYLNLRDSVVGPPWSPFVQFQRDKPCEGLAFQRYACCGVLENISVWQIDGTVVPVPALTNIVSIVLKHRSRPRGVRF